MLNMPKSASAGAEPWWRSGGETSALEVSHFMRYTNLRLTYLLTYLLSYAR